MDLERLLRQNWQRGFSPATLARGREYARRRHVALPELEYQGDSLVIRAAVQGTAPAPYLVEVGLSEGPAGLEVWTECSCPVAVFCKHAAAVLQSLADLASAIPNAEGDTGAVPTPDAWSPFLEGLATTTPAPPPVRPRADRRLAFLFDSSVATGAGSLLVKPVWVSPLKDGRLGKAVRLTRPLPMQGDALAELDDDQHDLVARLRMGLASYAQGREAYLVAGTRGEALLTTLIQTQRCYWQKPALGELAPGEDRVLSWRWKLAEDGTQNLVANIDMARVRLLRVASLWYCDLDSRRVGRITGDASLAQRLLAAPPLVPEHAQNIAARLTPHRLGAAIPPPLVFAAPRIVRVPAQPVLTLHLKRLRAYGKRQPEEEFAIARLDFDYDGHRVPTSQRESHTRRRIGAELLLIERNRAAEQSAEDRLEALGLAPLVVRSDLARRLRQPPTIGDWVSGKGDVLGGASQMLAMLGRLEADGFRIEFDPSFPVEVVNAPLDWYGEIEDGAGNAWFDLELGIELAGERVPLLPILAKALGEHSFPLEPRENEPEDASWLAPLDARRRVRLPLKRVRALLAPLLEWLERAEGPRLRLPRLAAGVVEELAARDGAALQARGGEALQEFAARLQGVTAHRSVALPAGLKAELRPYQRDGLAWLAFLAEAQIGGVLADDMGLGKTVQVLAHLLGEKHAGRLARPALVVAPTSVISNWKHEAARFTPGLRVLVLHGADRDAHFERILDHDLVVTSYALLHRDRDALLEHEFTLAVFDESQALKNPRAKLARIAREIRARRKLAVTGTPLENHLGELWAQLDLVLPGLLGDERGFTRHFRTPIEKHGDADRQARLNRRIAPFVLRRTKEDVAPELPPKTEIVREVELVGGQRELYETLRLAMHDKVRAAVRSRGLAQSSIVVLDALLKLRQACCDPRLVKLQAGRRATESAKLELLLPMLEELLDEGRTILLFSQFTEMLDLIEAAIVERGIAYARLDGSTRDRATPIRRFQEGEVPLFLVSLKAGGVGLNLTAADSVIHYDPWWNPAVETQATDRAHRIGQDKPVFVYKLICRGTVEEKIKSMQTRKAELARAVLEGGTRTALAFDERDLEDLFAPL